MIVPDHCSFCGAELLLGGIKYNVSIHIASAFDGYLPEATDENDEERRKQIERLISCLDSMSAEDAESEVYQEVDLVLCSGCRRRFMKSLTALMGKEIAPKPKQDTLLQ
jgi:hypothetical protein